MTGVIVTGSRGDIWKEKGHILTCGYSRSGKGISLLLPALLSNTLKKQDAPSFVVLDPKGENAAVAGQHLINCGYDIQVLNPFGINEVAQFGNSRFNPFDDISAHGRNFNKKIDLIRHAIMPPQAHKHENSFFVDSASNLLALYMSHLVTQDQEPKNIQTLYRWLRLAGNEKNKLLFDMALNEHFDIAPDAKAIMSQILEGSKAIADVYSNATTATAVFKDVDIRNSMSASDFNISDITRNKTAVFICLRPDELRSMDAWLRIVMACIMRGVTEHFNPNRKVVMMMDEFPQMGHLKEFQDGMGFLAGYNVTLWPVIQDLTQLKALYPSIWEHFVGGAAIRHWMARDNFTCKYIEGRMPKTLKIIGYNDDHSPRYIEKPLMTSEEIMKCETIILDMDGLKNPYLLPKVPYWEVTDNGSPNPFYTSYNLYD